MRLRPVKIPGALAAIAALAMSAASPPVQVSPLAGGAQSGVTKEALPPRQRAEKKKKVIVSGSPKPQRWRFDKRGNATDGCGDYRSAKRLRRRILMRTSGLPDTGRQWVRLRKTLRRAAPIVLTLHPLELLRLEREWRAAA